MFGDKPSPDFSVDAESVITAKVPPHDAGVVDVIIESNDGKKAKTNFTYLGG
jgi:hypothetical protein